MATPVLNNGIFLRDTNYQASSHVDSYHLTQMLGTAEPMDMGPIDLWAMTQKVEMPLYQMASFGGKNTIMVDNARGEYKWQTPIAQDLPYSLGKIDALTSATRGIDGQTFQILLSKRTFGHGDIITYDKYNGLEMYITADDILPSGDGYVYTVQLVNNNNTATLDDKYLVSGTKFFRKGSARGEYGERFSDLTTGTGFREFYNFVGGAEAHVHYTISSRADLMLKGGMNADGTIPVTEIWRTFDQDVDPSVSSLESMVEIMGADYVKRAFDNGNLSRTFLTNMEAAHLNKIASDIETYLMWGHGGRVKQDGPDDIRMSVGLWRQLDNSYKRIYNKSSFSLDMFKTELYNFYQGKVELEGPDPKRTLIVQTGIGGMKLVNDAIAKEAAGLGSAYVTNTDQVGMVTGSGMDMGFGYAFTSYVIPFLANVRFVLNPAFDNLHTNDIENPLIDGRPLSSYSFIIFDVTESGNDNIHLLKLSWDNALKWFYQNGTMDYMGRTQGFASSGNFNGYRVMMTQTMPAVWVKDPTKVLKIVMKNPITGGSF
uniref:Major capsid protein n=1 Tax=Virus NIOZ-UU157 TaxID=2763269 RepID=A0A7S9SU08_9VIRU|nr:MAG: hypothetical protein NIOZUU157_00226 [Virus NIOZ-UU157]